MDLQQLRWAIWWEVQAQRHMLQWEAERRAKGLRHRRHDNEESSRRSRWYKATVDTLRLKPYKTMPAWLRPKRRRRAARPRLRIAA